MADFKKLHAVDIAETASDAAKVLIEENGVIKRVPKDEVGGIKVAAAEVGQTIVVKAVDENGNPTEWEAVDKVTSWNDLEDKPFWEEVGKVVLIPKTVGIVGAYPHGIKYDSALLDFTYGKTATIKFDGVEYEAVCMENSDGFDVYRFYTPNNGWFVEFWDNGNIYSYSGDILFNEGESHIYEVYTIGTVVKPLDTKYLPEHLQFGEEVKLTPLVEEQTLNYVLNASLATTTGSEPNNSLLWVSCGKKATILIDGVEYEGRIDDNGDHSYITALLNDDKEFSYYDNGQSYMDSSLVGQHTISIFLKETIVHTLNEKYLPDSVKGGVEIVRGTITGEWDSGAHEFVNVTCDLTFDELYDAKMRGALVFLYFQGEALYYQYEYNDSDADNHLLFTNERRFFDLKYDDTYSIGDNNS